IGSSFERALKIAIHHDAAPFYRRMAQIGLRCRRMGSFRQVDLPSRRPKPTKKTRGVGQQPTTSTGLMTGDSQRMTVLQYLFHPMTHPQNPAITPELIREHAFTPEEYAKIEQLLGGRAPTLTELGIFSVMWSEHCSYKSSRVHLKRLPTRSKLVVQGPGENAGIIDIGDGWACAFKIESHNHPSFIEPFQGATTGVSGILRDIFTMGARPVAVMDSLRFGPIAESKSTCAGEGAFDSRSGQVRARQAEIHKN